MNMTPRNAIANPIDCAAVDAVVVCNESHPIAISETLPDNRNVFFGQPGTRVIAPYGIPQPICNSMVNVFNCRDPLKVFSPVIGFDSIDVVDEMCRRWSRASKCHQYQPVNVPPPSLAMFVNKVDNNIIPVVDKSANRLSLAMKPASVLRDGIYFFAPYFARARNLISRVARNWFPHTPSVSHAVGAD